MGRSGRVSERLSRENGPPQEAEVPGNLGGGPELGDVGASLSSRGWRRCREARGQACMQWGGGRQIPGKAGAQEGGHSQVEWPWQAL